VFLSIVGWLPLLGLLLTGLGLALVTIAVGDMVPPIRAARSVAGSMVAVESIASQTVLTGPLSRGGAAAAGEPIRMASGHLDRPANCLGAELATGQRAESMHLATVPLLRPADCGDVRDAIVALAALPRTGRATGAAHTPSAADRIDLTAAALYGPPDRRPQATQKALLEEGVTDGGRGRARHYLEESAASRWRTPWSH
jgi:hypothetical protein